MNTFPPATFTRDDTVEMADHRRSLRLVGIPSQEFATSITTSFASVRKEADLIERLGHSTARTISYAPQSPGTRLPCPAVPFSCLSPILTCAVLPAWHPPTRTMHQYGAWGRPDSINHDIKGSYTGYHDTVGFRAH